MVMSIGRLISEIILEKNWYVKSMKNLFVFPIIFFTNLPVLAQEVYSININRACASAVDIPYASDNFTDEEWQQFKDCLIFIKQFSV